MTKEKQSRLYRKLMSYSSAHNDFLSGTLIDRKILINFLEFYTLILGTKKI